jgi:hypothetical protein
MKKTFAFLLFLVPLIPQLHLNAQCSNQLPKRPPQGWGPGGRPATACEMLFYRNTYPQIINAFKKVETYFPTDQPSPYNPDPNLGMKDFEPNQTDPIFIHNVSVDEGSEKIFFQGMIKNLNWNYSVNHENEAFQKAYYELNNFFGNNGQYSAIEYSKALLEKIVFDKMGKDPKICKAKELEHELTNKFSFTASMQGINVSEDKLESSQASFELLNLKNCAYAIRVIKNKTITDAGDAEQSEINNHIDELHLYIGKWKAPQIKRGNGFVVQNDFNLSQSKLSVQNLLIVIKCAPELQEEVLKQINLGLLHNLVLQ